MFLFRGVAVSRLIKAAARLSAESFNAGELIYQQGEQGNKLYIVFRGQVRVSRDPRKGKAARVLGLLEEGDFFGADVFKRSGKRRSTVSALSDCILLTLDAQQATAVSEVIPELPNRVNLALESAILVERKPFTWVEPSEYIHYASRQHSLLLWGKVIPWILLGGIILGLAAALLPVAANPWLAALPAGAGLLLVGGLIWMVMDWGNDYYLVTRQRVVAQERIQLLYDSRLESPVDHIQSVETTSTQFGRIFNYGDVAIRTLTGLIVFRSVSDPRTVAGLIQELQSRSRNVQHQAELRQIDETIRQRLDNRAQQASAHRIGRGSYKPAQGLLSRLFQLRSVFGETVQFRTHWFILLRRLFLPGLLVLVAFGGGVWVLARTSAGLLDQNTATIALLGICALFLAAVCWWLFTYLDWHNDVYLITPDMVVDVNQKPLGKEEKRSAPIKNILSIEYKRLGLSGLLLNFGTVYIRVGDTVLTFDDVSDPSEVQRELFFHISQRETRERQFQEEKERQRIADWISAYHRISGTPE